MEYGVSLIIGYFIGCFQTGIILGKLFKKGDIRQQGSGNAGTTNALRVLGLKFGIMTFLGDFLKAIVAVIVIRYLFEGDLYPLISGLGVVLGHNFPVFLKFKGGKGIAATVGTFLAFDYRIALIAMLIMIIVVALTRYVSLGSLIMTTWIPIGLYIYYPQQIELMLFGIVFTVFAYIRHKANIQRLLTGNENKLGSKKTS